MKIKFKKYWRTTSLKKKGDGDFFLKHIEKIKPKYYVVENVKGLAEFLPKPNDIIKYNRHKDGKAAYLWSNIGKLGFLCSTINMKVNTSKIKKLKSTLHKKSERALIPYPISKAVLTKIEND